MRKGFVAGNGIKKIKGIYTYYSAEGLNLDRFIESLKKKGIDLYRIKKRGKKMTFAVNFCDNEKFFAIIRDVWYNTLVIKKIKDGGVNYPFLFFAKNAGALIGAVIFTVAAIFSGDVIFSFSFTGSGAVYKREIKEYLASVGVSEMSRFSSVDLGTLADGILGSSDRLSFVSCKKDGNRLVIDSVLSTESPKALSGRESALIADRDGVIESVKVYRGTAVKSAGEEVKAGDVIVEGYAVIKEEKYSVNVIATATILYKETCTVSLAAEDFDAALSAAEENFPLEPAEYSFVKTEKEGRFFYEFTLWYRYVITVG